MERNVRSYSKKNASFACNSCALFHFLCCKFESCFWFLLLFPQTPKNFKFRHDCDTGTLFGNWITWLQYYNWHRKSFELWLKQNLSQLVARQPLHIIPHYFLRIHIFFLSMLFFYASEPEVGEAECPMVRWYQFQNSFDECPLFWRLCVHKMIEASTFYNSTLDENPFICEPDSFGGDTIHHRKCLLVNPNRTTKISPFSQHYR